ncbi:MAG: HRDC domain-containing protein [Muribaculaceae bacterium]|nr:HRDC domain-containing protein [Muribaculaceae bacterium]
MENKQMELAWRLVEHTGANVFLTGKAGTGKTTFLKRLKAESMKTMVILAPTGIAALNAEGMTIHSFFQLSFSPYIPGIGQAESGTRFKKLSKDKVKIIRSLDTIVIDEISMVRADILDAIDAKLRQLRHSPLPFGGVQIIMIGDMQQLPPVVKEEEWNMLSEYYHSPYFFDSKVLSTTPYETIELTKVYRQKDADFIKILNAIRENRADNNTLLSLNSRYYPNFNPPESDRYIRLMTHNRQAHDVNVKKMQELSATPHNFEAEIEGEFPELIYPVEKNLTLKEGAQVMFVKNDSSGARRYYNGLIGHIRSISENGKVVVVTDDDMPPIEVEKETWENTAYTIDEKSKEMKEKVVGRFTQIPLRAAWAITIHKSQGLTFDKAIINASAAFAHGQTYVALSRCRSLEGLVLERPLPPSSIICDSKVSNFEQACSAREADSTKVDRLQTDFDQRLDLEVPDLTGLRNAMDNLHRVLQSSHAAAFPKMTAAYGELFNKQFKALYDVSLRFQQQLRNMAAKGNTPNQIHDRLKAASNYFLKELRPIFQFLKDLPTEIDNKDALKKFVETMNMVEYEAKLKEALMEATLKKKLSAADFLKIKREISLSDNTWLKITSKNNSAQLNSDIENPELYQRLADWRRQKAREEGVAAFMILGNKTLVILANEMPQDEDDLSSIPGIGKKKKADYGSDLLDIIRSYKS